MDTTAKVDIRKLQLLNDRIAQTMEALNQVRLSVHGLGLSHTAGVPGIGYGSATPYQAIASQAQAVPGVGWPSIVPGLSHTSPYAFAQPYAQAYGQYAQSPFTQSYAQQVNPLLQQMLWQQGLGGGLSHTSPDVYGSAYGVGYPGAAIDPFTMTRIAHMFPFAQMPISPVQ